MCHVPMRHAAGKVGQRLLSSKLGAQPAWTRGTDRQASTDRAPGIREHRPCCTIRLPPRLASRPAPAPSPSLSLRPHSWLIAIGHCSNNSVTGCIPPSFLPFSPASASATDSIKCERREKSPHLSIAGPDLDLQFDSHITHCIWYSYSNILIFIANDRQRSIGRGRDAASKVGTLNSSRFF